MKFAKQDPARTVAHAQRSLETGHLSVIADMVIQERHVTILVSVVPLECAMEDVVRMLEMIASDVFVLQVSLGRGVSKVCAISKLVCLLMIIFVSNTSKERTRPGDKQLKKITRSFKIIFGLTLSYLRKTTLLTYWR